MRKVRIAVLGLAAAVVVGALFQLPASPFARRNAPEGNTAGASPTARPTAEPGATPTPADQGATPTPAQQAMQPTVQATVPADPPPPVVPDRTITYPNRGNGTYAVLPGDPATIGRQGRLMTFRIGIEGGIAGIDRSALGRFVRQTYGAPQGWTAGGKYRFRQVGPGRPFSFQLLFVTPATRDKLCGGSFDHYTSCRIGDRVVLNVARWVQGVPHYGTTLAAYREYMLNHETGHRLGEAHELCPGPGRPAPVMQQQTLGLHGCTPNAWPYLNGTRYEGRLGKYDDPIPRA